MPTVAAIYTAQALLKPLREAFDEYLPDCRLINIVDDSLIARVIANGGVDHSVTRRLMLYYEAAAEAGADYIFNTCSSIGDVVYQAQPFIRIPIIRIDSAMAKEAVSSASRIGVLATLPTTLEPTARLVEREAALVGKSPVIEKGLAEGAFQALLAGDTERHNRLIMQTAESLAARVDIFLLAQGSMAVMERPIAGKTGIPVLSSLPSGVQYLKEVMGKDGKIT